MNFEKFPIINNPINHFFHIVGLVRVVRHNFPEFRVSSLWVIVWGHSWWVLHVILGDKFQQFTDIHQNFFFSVIHKMSHAGFLRMNVGSAQFIVSHFLVRSLLYNIGSCDIHVTGTSCHENEISQRWGVNSPPGRGTKNC